MSKFFQYSGDTETETESEEEIVQQQKPIGAKKIAYVSSEEEELNFERKFILPEKVKRSKEINDLIKNLNNKKNIKDIVKCAEIFDDLIKIYDKCKKITEKDGHFKQYIRCIADLEKYVNDCWNNTEWRASASSNNIAALKRLRQKVKKYNKDYENEISEYNKNHENYPEFVKYEDEEEIESPKIDEEKRAIKVVRVLSDEEELSDEWTQSEYETTTEEEIENEDIWTKFLKKADERKDITSIAKKSKIKAKKQEEIEETEEPGLGDEGKAQLFLKDEEITGESVLRKIDYVQSLRGRKDTSQNFQLEKLNEIKDAIQKHNLGTGLEVKVLINQIEVNFEYNRRLHKSIKVESWSRCLLTIEKLLNLVQEFNIELFEYTVDVEESLFEAPFRVKCSLLGTIERVNEEFIKILQQYYAHGSDYVERLRDEPKICSLINKMLSYFETHSSRKDEICRIYLVKIESIYYKYDSQYETHSKLLMDKLCKYIYVNDETNRLRTQAILYHIYHHAIHNNYREARDLILMSHLQESINYADLPLQVMYNRAIVQFGLCAFRCGYINESHSALLDIQSSNKAKELLAQGIVQQRFNIEKSKEQELRERQRLLPYHMHINLELVEFVYLVTAILIDVPYMCSKEFETKRHLISKQFYYYLKSSERQALIGPPDNMREHVMAASRALKNADWIECVRLLVNQKIDSKVWNFMHNVDEVKQMLIEKIKEATLKAYIYKYSSVYDTISIKYLAEMLDLSTKNVNSLICKMIVNEEVMASVDETTEIIIIHRTEPSKVQTQSLLLADKVSSLIESTDRSLQFKVGEISSTITKNVFSQQDQYGKQAVKSFSRSIAKTRVGDYSKRNN